MDQKPQDPPGKTYKINLHTAEKKLIELIRSMKSGEIDSIKIQNGLPIFYIINLENKRFI